MKRKFAVQLAHVATIQQSFGQQKRQSNRIENSTYVNVVKIRETEAIFVQVEAGKFRRRRSVMRKSIKQKRETTKGDRKMGHQLTM